MSLLHIYVFLLKFVCYQQYLRKFLKKYMKKCLNIHHHFLHSLRHCRRLHWWWCLRLPLVCRGRSMSLTMEFEVALKCSLAWTHTTFHSVERPTVIPACKNYNQIYQLWCINTRLTQPLVSGPCQMARA